MLTYDLISRTTLSSAASSVTFSSITGSYADLVIIGQIIGTVDSYINMQVGNGSVDTGNNYSITTVGARYNAGEERSSQRYTSQSTIYATGYNWYNTNPSNLLINLQNYADTTTYKTMLIRFNSTGTTSYAGTSATVGLWRSTSAINIVTFSAGSSTFASGSTFSLFGIAG